jgi:hypothetical protein
VPQRRRRGDRYARAARRAGSGWPVIIRRRVIVGRRPCQRPDRRGDDQRRGADDGARHAKWPKQWKRRAWGITPSPSWRGTPSRGTRGLIVRRVPAARLKASEFVAVQLSGRALRRRLLLRIVLRLGGRKRQSGEPGGERGRNRNLADTHGAPPGLDPARRDHQTYPAREGEAYSVSRERARAKEIGPRRLAMPAFSRSGNALPVRKGWCRGAMGPRFSAGVTAVEFLHKLLRGDGA